jgi:hypothetical protein
MIGTVSTCSLPTVACHSAQFALCQSTITWLPPHSMSAVCRRPANGAAVHQLLKEHFLLSGLGPPSVIPKWTKNFRNCISYRTLLKTPWCTYRIVSVYKRENPGARSNFGKAASLSPYEITDSRSQRCKQYRALTDTKSVADIYCMFTKCLPLTFMRSSHYRQGTYNVTLGGCLVTTVVVEKQ